MPYFQRLSDLFSHGDVKDGPFNGFEILNFRGRQYLQDQSDVFNILRESPLLTKKLETPPSKNYEDESFQADLQSSGLSYGFWNNVQPDVPWQLDEGIRSTFSKVELAQGPLAPKVGRQLLSRHPIYTNAVLVRDYFRCVPRSDGCQRSRHLF